MVPPEPVFGKCMELKNNFALAHSSYGALRSPPHITLHMPFNWADRKLNNLIAAIESIARDLTSFKIQLNGFGCFPPRVIFVRVETSPQLILLHKKTEQIFKTELDLFNALYKNEPFIPHITVAFRDLSKNNFHLAWQNYEQKSFEENWMHENLCLLKHNGQRWEPFKWFPLR